MTKFRLFYWHFRWKNTNSLEAVKEKSTRLLKTDEMNTVHAQMIFIFMPLKETSIVSIDSNLSISHLTA